MAYGTSYLYTHGSWHDTETDRRQRWFSIKSIEYFYAGSINHLRIRQTSLPTVHVMYARHRITSTPCSVVSGLSGDAHSEQRRIPEGLVLNACASTSGALRGPAPPAAARVQAWDGLSHSPPPSTRRQREWLPARAGRRLIPRSRLRDPLSDTKPPILYQACTHSRAEAYYFSESSGRGVTY